MIKETGLWWEYTNKRGDSFRILRNYEKGVGFTKNEAEKIAPQVKKKSIRSMCFGESQEVSITLEGKSRRVLIGSLGAVEKFLD